VATEDAVYALQEKGMQVHAYHNADSVKFENFKKRMRALVQKVADEAMKMKSGLAFEG
jgi:hypothetical protein